MLPKDFTKACLKKKVTLREPLCCKFSRVTMWDGGPDWAVLGWLWIGWCLWSGAICTKELKFNYIFSFCANKLLFVKFKQSFLWHSYFFLKNTLWAPQHGNALFLPEPLRSLVPSHFPSRVNAPIHSPTLPRSSFNAFRLPERLRQNENREVKLFAQLHSIRELETGRNS